MSNDKTDPSAKAASISSADKLTKTTKKADIELAELSDDELSKVTGGKHVSNVKWTPG